MPIKALEGGGARIPHMEAFRPVRRVLGSPREADVLDAVYAQLPAVNFSQAILAQSAQRLAVLHLQGVYWSDWGDPRRLLLDLARFRDQERPGMRVWV